MLIAEIRNKLSDLDDVDIQDKDPAKLLQAYLASHKEDLLTADVFGVLKYLPRKPFLEHLLRGIQQRNTHAVRFSDRLNQLSFGERDFDFRFWPSYQTPMGIDHQRTEPDVEIVSDAVKIFVEAKLNSDFGELQIVRQLLIGLDDPKPEREFFLLLATKGFQPPRIQFEGKQRNLSDYLQRVAPTLGVSATQRDQIANASDRVLWVNWRTIASLLRECQSLQPPDRDSRCHEEMISDLEILLKMRSLAPFHGLSALMPQLPQKRPVLAGFLSAAQSNKRPLTFSWLNGRALSSVASYEAPKSKVVTRFKFDTIATKMSSLETGRLLMRTDHE